MSKQIVLRAALICVCTLMIGLSGCHNQSDAKPLPAGDPGKPPSSQMEQINNLPPEQKQRALEQMQASQGGAKPNAGAATSSSGNQ